MYTLYMDEIYLKTNMLYDISKDKVIQFVDLGGGKKSQLIATSAIVVMARGIAENWKQSLSYFLVHESSKSSEVKGILLDAINKIYLTV